jgi:hypothetical protein
MAAIGLGWVPGMSLARRVLVPACALTALLALAAPVGAAGLDDASDQWLPRSDGTEWVYQWSNSSYSSTPRRELYRVEGRRGTSFSLRWEEPDPPAGMAPSAGKIDFMHTDAGLISVNWQSTPPPSEFPILCASATACGNSLAGTLYMLIWGNRSPVLAEPLVNGSRWNSLGGAGNDVASTNSYRGRSKVVVPAFPEGVRAAKVESEITQAGAIGDPFGSGVRTVHWVRGVGPVKIVFRHAGGELSTAELVRTTLAPLPLPPADNLLPLNRGDRGSFRWRNSRHMRRWSKQRFQVAEVVNNTARVDIEHVSGPIKVAGSYTFATRLSGVTNLSAFTRAATRAELPPLGPRRLPADRRRRFFTPFDLMTFGFNPVLPAYPAGGESWRSSRGSRDWRVFGVTGRSKVAGARRVRTPAGRFRAIVVKSRLTQKGFRFGSGRRTMWFAPQRGLVKLRFRHGDGSVSTVERVR